MFKTVQKIFMFRGTKIIAGVIACYVIKKVADKQDELGNSVMADNLDLLTDMIGEGVPNKILQISSVIIVIAKEAIKLY